MENNPSNHESDISEYSLKSIDQLIGRYPELTELQDTRVQESAALLASEFSIDKSFFEGEKGEARTLLLCSVASNLAALEASGKNSSSNPEDYEFIADMTMIVAMDFVQGFDEITRDAKLEMHGPLSETAKEQILKKYTSPELTTALQEKIDSTDLLTNIKSKLGITEENEDPYELVVLSVSSSDTSIFGFDSNVEYPDDKLWKTDRELALQQYEDATNAADLARNWEADLIANTEKFAHEYGQDVVPPAFIDKLEGTTYLCLSADTAERIAYSEDRSNRSKYYSEDDFKRDVAFLRHEYVHTQGGLLSENLIGITLEERRAELFSGDHHGYQDVKHFLQDIRLVTGYDIVGQIEARTKGGAMEDVLADIAQNIGLSEVVKIAASFPKNYVEQQSNQILKSAAKYTGGYNGVVEHLAKRVQSEGLGGGELAMQQRIDQEVERVAKINPDFVESWLSYRKQTSEYGTALIQARVKAT